MNQGKMLLGFCVICACFVSACVGKDDGAPAVAVTSNGPVDGTYLLTGVTCNGVSSGSLPSGQEQRLIIQNSVGSFITVYSSDGCVKTEGQVLAYPGSSLIAMQQVNTVCSGGTCQSSECTASSTAGSVGTYNYVLSGSTFSLSYTSQGGDGCNAGETIAYVMSKQ